MKSTISLEFFPPQTASATEQLLSVHQALSVLDIEFCSVTYGAAGSSRQRTLHFVEALLEKQPNHAIYPHLISTGTDQETLQSLLKYYQQLGIQGMVVLRGDEPLNGPVNEILPDAVSLVKAIRQHCGTAQKIYVAAYPEIHPLAISPQADIDVLKSKADAGADAAITQYFYNIDAYKRFCDEVAAKNCDIPIIPGIMPITNAQQLIRFSEHCGADIPRWIRQRLIAYQQDKDSLIAFGLDVVSNLCEQLIDNKVPSLHFYSMNRVEPTLAISRNLGWI